MQEFVRLLYEPVVGAHYVYSPPLGALGAIGFEWDISGWRSLGFGWLGWCVLVARSHPTMSSDRATSRTPPYHKRSLC
ncbi:MAG: hypothetical protein GDA43_00490 [Hormoscilla sp. SP5CHS1]|nr:hypothetical protein [Hormoscilla sp. SP5CHS1]